MSIQPVGPKQLPNLNDTHSNSLVSAFLDSIKLRAYSAEIFINVLTGENEQLLKFSSFTDLHLYGTDLNGHNVKLSISDIRSIEIMPKIGNLVKPVDKDRLAQIGITFDSHGFIKIPKERFKYEKKVSGNNYHTTIYSKEETEIVYMNAKKAFYESFCMVDWAEDESE